MMSHAQACYYLIKLNLSTAIVNLSTSVAWQNQDMSFTMRSNHICKYCKWNSCPWPDLLNVRHLCAWGVGKHSYLSHISEKKGFPIPIISFHRYSFSSKLTNFTFTFPQTEWERERRNVNVNVKQNVNQKKSYNHFFHVWWQQGWWGGRLSSVWFNEFWRISVFQIT